MTRLINNQLGDIFEQNLIGVMYLAVLRLLEVDRVILMVYLIEKSHGAFMGL